MQQSWETLLQSALCVATSTPSSLPSTPKPCSVDSSQGTLPDLDEDPTMLHTIPTPKACAGTMQDCYEELEAMHHVLIQEYTLHYPWECVPRVFRNACDGQTEGDIIVWLDSFNVLGCPKLRRKMERLESNSFGAFTCPSVSGLHAARMGRFFALFVLCDDAVVEPAAEFGVTFDQLQVFVDAVLAAGKQDSFEHFAANAPEPLAVVVNGIPLGNIARMWFEFVKQYLNDGASQEWLKRFADAVATYLRLGLQEANMTSSLQQSWERDDVFAVPSDASNTQVLRTIFQQRIAAIGVPMMALLLERACNVNEVTWREVFSPWVDEAIDHVAIASFLVNDLYGLARDIVRNEHCFNDMLLVARFKKLSAMQGVQFAISLHDSAVDHVVALTVDRSNEPSALDFSHALRFLVRGYGQWHAHCSRYRECVAISSSCALTFIVQDEAKSITKHLC